MCSHQLSSSRGSSVARSPSARGRASAPPHSTSSRSPSRASNGSAPAPRRSGDRLPGPPSSVSSPSVRPAGSRGRRRPRGGRCRRRRRSSSSPPRPRRVSLPVAAVEAVVVRAAVDHVVAGPALDVRCRGAAASHRRPAPTAPKYRVAPGSKRVVLARGARGGVARQVHVHARRVVGVSEHLARLQDVGARAALDDAAGQAVGAGPPLSAVPLASPACRRPRRRRPSSRHSAPRGAVIVSSPSPSATRTVSAPRGGQTTVAASLGEHGAPRRDARRVVQAQAEASSTCAISSRFASPGAAVNVHLVRSL